MNHEIQEAVLAVLYQKAEEIDSTPNMTITEKIDKLDSINDIIKFMDTHEQVVPLLNEAILYNRLPGRFSNEPENFTHQQSDFSEIGLKESTTHMSDNAFKKQLRLVKQSSFKGEKG